MYIVIVLLIIALIACAITAWFYAKQTKCHRMDVIRLKDINGELEEFKATTSVKLEIIDNLIHDKNAELAAANRLVEQTTTLVAAKDEVIVSMQSKIDDLTTQLNSTHLLRADVESAQKMKQLIAEDLLKIKAVFLRPNEPFTWASGIKSPIYCDNRLTLSDTQVRNDVENGLAQLIKEHYPQAEVLMGTSTAGIAHAAITATILDLPMGYVRSGAKDHGRGNQIEGKLLPGQKVVVVEDLISTGGSCIEVVNVLREAGADVLGIVSIFTYGMKKGLERLAAAEVKNVSLCDLDTLVEVAADKAYIAIEDKERLIKFRNNPSDESWMC